MEVEVTQNQNYGQQFCLDVPPDVALTTSQITVIECKVKET